MLNIVPVSLLLFVLFSPVAGIADSPDLSELTEQPGAAHQLASVCMNFNALNTRIRDSRIDSRSARDEVTRLLAELRNEYYRVGGIEYPKAAWVFPLSGYDARAIGGGRRHGFSGRGYDFFSGNRHGGHPSYDIFIRDRNQDGRDFRSGQPVKVISMTGGVVVALEGEWEPGSRLKGGKYVWIYDPTNDLLVYYAHNADLFVTLGDVVKPGDVLATVGRSGWNAAKRRSPTHLHLTVLKMQNGKVEPVKVYRELTRAVRVFLQA
jgi:murein DD-endopeptidase MepM/ murein hydrolase activator NlpD